MLRTFSSSKLQQYNNTDNPFGHNRSKNPKSNIVGEVTRFLTLNHTLMDKPISNNGIMPNSEEIKQKSRHIVVIIQ